MASDKQPLARSGKWLENLVAALERSLAGSGAVVESPSRRLRDRDTGRCREHDVLITWDHGHHQVITAIECRNRSRPVGVPAVEAFADKCACTGVHHGVIVSATGFQKSAREKAGQRGITCMELSEVARFPWLGTPAIHGYRRHFETLDLQVMFEDAMPDRIISFVDPQGVELPAEELGQVVVHYIPNAENPEEEADKEIPLRMRLLMPKWRARDGEGRLWSIDHVLAFGSFRTIRTEGELKSLNYSGGGKDYSVAAAEVEVGEHIVTLMIVDQPEGESREVWLKSRPK